MLQRGVAGNFARMWQKFLLGHGSLEGPADGRFGAQTLEGTRRFQAAEGLEADGVVGPQTFAAALRLGWPAPEGLPFIQATHFTTAGRGPGEVSWIVLHTMEVPERSNIALEIAGRFAAESSPPASPHYCIDDQWVIQNVLLKDVAWHAEAANRCSIGIEHAGTASQTEAEWADEVSARILSRSAALTKKLCSQFSIPVRWLDAYAIRRAEKGITGHAQVNDAFLGIGQGHRDPGRRFPVDDYLARVNAAI